MSELLRKLNKLERLDELVEERHRAEIATARAESEIQLKLLHNELANTMDQMLSETALSSDNVADVIAKLDVHKVSDVDCCLRIPTQYTKDVLDTLHHLPSLLKDGKNSAIVSELNQHMISLPEKRGDLERRLKEYDQLEKELGAIGEM